MQRRLVGLLLAATTSLALACTPASAPATPSKPAAGPATTASPSVTAASAPSPSPAAADSSAASPVAVSIALADGRTHPGPYFLGKADAPVTLDEYADFS